MAANFQQTSSRRPANVQQFTCILNTFAGSLLDVCWTPYNYCSRQPATVLSSMVMTTRSSSEWPALAIRGTENPPPTKPPYDKTLYFFFNLQRVEFSLQIVFARPF